MLPLPQIEILTQVISRKQKPVRLLCLGYPDIVVPPEHLERTFGADVVARCRRRDDSAEIIGWHGMTGKLDWVVDSLHLFELLDVEVSIIDIVEARGGEIIVDLNRPMPDSFRRSFDIVLDPGTIEHCFNIGQAMMNLADATKQDGYVLHYSPMSMVNHGFVNLNPTFFADFYSQNGFVIQALSGVATQGFFKVPPVTRMSNVPAEASLLVAAQRTSLQDLKWPTQGKYLSNPTLRA